MAKKEKKVTNKENSKENKNKKSFFKGLKAELKKVIWPTPKQLFNNTVAVITIVLLTAIIVFILDFAFESLNKYGVNKIKDSIQSIESTTDENTSNSNEVDENGTANNESTGNENTDTQTTSENSTSEEGQSSDNATNETQENSTNNAQ